MIVKLLRALDPPGAPAMLCDQRRGHLSVVPMTPALAALFVDREKIYVEAERVGGGWSVRGVVPDRAW